MPYKTNADLPEDIKNALPSAAQSIFRHVFNSVNESGANEESSMKQAWGAVKNAGYKKIKESVKWQLTKADASFINEKDPEENMSKVSIVKTDPAQKLVFGFFNINKVGENLVEDLQGHRIETSELEKAVYGYVLDARVQGEGHIRKGVGRLVESVMFTYEKQAAIKQCLAAQGITAEINLGCEGWFGGFKVDDEAVWKAIEKGDYPAFSIGGTGKQIPVED